jgi:hypothetical protein
VNIYEEKMQVSTTPPLPTCSSSQGRRTGRKILDEGRKILNERTKEIIKDEGQNIGRKDGCSGTKDLLNLCKLNLLKDSKTPGKYLTGKLTKLILRTKFSQKK